MTARRDRFEPAGPYTIQLRPNLDYRDADGQRRGTLIEIARLQIVTARYFARLQAELRALGAGLDAIGTAARRLTRPGADDWSCGGLIVEKEA